MRIRPRAAPSEQLTPRQREVMELIAQGRTNPEIATELGMTIDGAKWHVREILSKFGVDSREEAVAEWRRRQRPWARALAIAAATLAAGVAAVAVGTGLWIASQRTTSPGAGTTAPATLAATATAAPKATSSVTTVAASGEVPFSGATVRDGGVATASAARPPATASLAGANSLLATGAVLLAATNNGISRSTNGGKDWTAVFSGSPMHSLTAAADGHGYVALGHTAYVDDADQGHAVLATSADGIHWQSLIPQATAEPGRAPFGVAERIAFNGIGDKAIGIAMPDIVATPQPQGAWRTTDGGRTWSPLSRAGDTGVQMLPDGHTAYITAGGADPASCAGEVYRSTDAGATWTGLPASCQTYALYAVQFLDANVGFAAGGSPAKFGGDQVVEKTTDGGATWQTIWRTSPGPDPANPASDDSQIVRLDMADASHGWAMTGGCTGGANGACGGAIYVTTDGGVQWSRTQQVATALSVLSDKAAVIGTAGGPLATTTDGGERWAAQAPAGSVRTTALSGSSGWIAWTTSLGVFESKDGGQTWSAFDPPILTVISDWPWSVASPGNVLGTSNSGGAATTMSTDNGQISSVSLVGTSSGGTTIQVLATSIGPGSEAAAITGPMRGCLDAATIAKAEKVKPGWQPSAGTVALFLSDDAGRTWTPGADLPFDVVPGNALAIAGETIAITDACGNIHISGDKGTNWHALDDDGSKPSPICSVAAAVDEVWLACSTMTPDFRSEGWILSSDNSGKSWTMFRLPSDLTATEPLTTSGIVATGPRSAVMAAGAALWSTTNAGASWTETWPPLPGEH